jgi:hypothetical protein
MTVLATLPKGKRGSFLKALAKLPKDGWTSRKDKMGKGWIGEAVSETFKLNGEVVCILHPIVPAEVEYNPKFFPKL